MPPICTIIAGPNGSGKSTIYEVLKPIGEFVNTDVIARKIDSLNSQNVDLAAAKMTLERLAKLLNDGLDFVFETTMSGHQPLSLIESAKDSGYQVALVFIALSNAELNVARVEQRVARGGHNIPPDVVRRRYLKSFKNLGHAIKLVDGLLIYDNSGEEMELLIRSSGFDVEINNLDLSKSHHQLIWNSIFPNLVDAHRPNQSF